MTVAAIPPCSAIRFRNPKVPRYPPPARRAPCLLRMRGKCDRGVRREVRHLDFGGCSAILARHAGKRVWRELSGPISRDIARKYRYDTPYRAILSRPSQQYPNRVRYPFLAPSLLHRHISAIPHFATYRAILVHYPGKQARKKIAILSLKVSRDMKSIAAGPLSRQV